MGDEPNVRVKVPKDVLRRSHKERRFIQTAGRWPRKSAAAKKCVTTYLPNESASKMDGAKAHYRDSTVDARGFGSQIPGRCRRDRRVGGCVKAVEKPMGDQRWNDL